MSKFLKALGIGLGTLVGLLALILGIVYFASSRRLARHFEVQPPAVAIPTGAAAIDAGRHIAAARGCLACHGENLAGATVIDNPAMGLMSGPNLTRGRGGVVANYTDVDWVRSIRHGINPQGRPLVLMPSMDFAGLTDEDLGEIIAFAKSLPPVDLDSVPLRIGPVARALIVAGKFPIAAELIDHRATPPASIVKAANATYGRYVSSTCMGCHNESFTGGKIQQGPPDWPPAANLTPAGNLARWSEAEFITALRTAKRPDGTEINAVMPRAFAQLDDVELKALYAFFKTLPAKPTGVR